jgi:hypothetical protein
MGFTITSSPVSGVGGGTGTPLIRAAGLLRGFTTAPYPAQPPLISLTFNEGPWTDGTVTIYTDFTSPILLRFEATNSGASGIWVDISSTDAATIANNFVSALASHYVPETTDAFGNIVNFEVDGEDTRYMALRHSSTGASAQLSINPSNLSDLAVNNPGGYGTNQVPGSGQIDEVILIPKVTGKIIKLTDLFITTGGIGTVVRYAFKNAGGTYFRVAQDLPYPGAYAIPSRADYADVWLNGRADCDLVALLTVIPNGGSVTCYAFAEQY